MSSGNRQISRRDFLVNSSKLAVGATALSTLASCSMQKVTPAVAARILGANDRINLAVIGIRGRGMELTTQFAQIKNVHIKTICDIDQNVSAAQAKKLSESTGYTPPTEYEMQRVFDDKNIDAVIIATPNHWHALATIWACQAGKHVYVEKPCCHNPWEGRKMVEAAEKYNRIVSVGFQNRSLNNVRQAMAFLHSGGIGDVYMARGLCFKPRDTIGQCADGIGKGKDYEYYIWGQKGTCYDQTYMNKVHYDIWTGPAPVKPFNYNRFHYNWHWNWNYGSGDIGNQGPHQFDIARWGLAKNEHPVKITSSGGYFGPKCDQQTPNTQIATLEYADGKLLQFEVRGLYTNDEAAVFEKIEGSGFKKNHDGIVIGNLFYGTKGWLYLNGGTWQSYFGRKDEKGPGSSASDKNEFADPMNMAGAGGGGHFNNFIYALSTNNSKNLTCNMYEGYMSSALPLLCNISYRLGRTLGFDGKKEKFAGDSQADIMLTRKYRRPYVVPDRV